MRNNYCFHSSNHLNFKSRYTYWYKKHIIHLFAVLSRSRYLTSETNTHGKHLNPNRPTYAFLISLLLLMRVKSFDKKYLHPLETRGSSGSHFKLWLRHVHHNSLYISLEIIITYMSRYNEFRRLCYIFVKNTLVTRVYT